MPIEMKHGGATSIIANYAGAQGKGRSQLKEKQLEARNQRVLASRKQRQDRLTREDTQEHDLDRLKLGNELQQGRMELQSDLNQNEDVLRSGLRGEEFEFKLTAQQKADDEKLRNDLYAVENDDTLDEFQKEDARQQLHAKRRGIKKTEERLDPSRYAPGQGLGETWYDPKTGTLNSRSLEGAVTAKEHTLPGEVDPKTKASVFSQLLNNMADVDGNIDWDKLNEVFPKALEAFGGKGGGGQDDFMYRFGADPGREGIPGVKGQPSPQDQLKVAAGLPVGGGPAPAEAIKAAFSDGPDSWDIVPVEGLEHPFLAQSNPQARDAWNGLAQQVNEAEQKLAEIEGAGSETGEFEGLASINEAIQKAEENLASEKKKHVPGTKGYKSKGKPVYFTNETVKARQDVLKGQIEDLKAKKQLATNLQEKMKIRATAARAKLKLMQESMAEAE